MSAILNALAMRYRESKAGRTGRAAGDFVVDYKHLLSWANAEDGEARAAADLDIRVAAGIGGSRLRLDTHRRDPMIIHTVRLLSDGGEKWLFARLNQDTPYQEREALSHAIAGFMDEPMPAEWAHRWRVWISALRSKAKRGDSVAPLSKTDLTSNGELLRVLVRLLNWQGQSLLRFASCVICGESKRLGELRGKLENCLRQISGAGTSLADLGILDHPRHVLLHGPLRLHLPGGTLDLALLQGPITLSETDLVACESVECLAERCLSVENEATFVELAKLRTKTLLVQTSYPGRAVRRLFERLPATLPCHHFGDSDPAGFEILRDLRAKTGRAFAPLRMDFRDHADSPLLSAEEKRHLTRLLADPLLEDVREPLSRMLAAGRKGTFEQESLGPPGPEWPFYP
jgi:hypothetical protein